MCGVDDQVGGNISSDTTTSSSEEEFCLPQQPPRQRRRSNSVRVHPDYVGRRVSVPSGYFNVDKNEHYLGTVNRWGRFKNIVKQNSYGYYIHYDEGDKYWMIESDVHKYII